jgi:hypothetical protein
VDNIANFYTWRKAATSQLRQEFMLMAVFTGSIYWITGLLAILQPETMGVGPESAGTAIPQGKIFLAPATILET